MGNVIVAQSGGPTVAINASLAGVIEGTIGSNYDKIYGSINGILGIRDDNIIDFVCDSCDSKGEKNVD